MYHPKTGLNRMQALNPAGMQQQLLRTDARGFPAIRHTEEKRQSMVTACSQKEVSRCAYRGGAAAASPDFGPAQPQPDPPGGGVGLAP